MRVPGLTQKEITDLNSLFETLKENPNSTESLKVRSNFFVPGQKIAYLRYFFNRLPYLKLTDGELSVIRRVIVKPKSAEWSIIKEIIKYQTQLNESQILEWFNYIPELSRLPVAMSIISNNRVYDNDFKLKLVRDMMNHINYMKDVIMYLDTEIQYEPNLPFYKSVADVILEYINRSDSISLHVAKLWTQYSKNLDGYAKNQQLTSPLLYQLTRLEQYLPTTAKDIFIF